MLIGQGLGPLFVGVLSDVLGARATIGEDGLRYALLLALSASAIAVVFYGLAARHVTRDLARAGVDFETAPARGVG